jgi:hypothetical protein
MLNSFKLHNKLYLYRHFLQIKKTNFFLNPIYKFSKQFFVKKTFFEDFLQENTFKGFFVTKSIINSQKLTKIVNLNNYNSLYGYNYYIYNTELTNFLSSNINVEKNEDLLKVKWKFEFSNHHLFNYYINYNIYILNVVELYKIMILINLK